MQVNSSRLHMIRANFTVMLDFGSIKQLMEFSTILQLTSNTILSTFSINIKINSSPNTLFSKKTEHDANDVSRYTILTIKNDTSVSSTDEIRTYKWSLFLNLSERTLIKTNEKTTCTVQYNTKSLILQDFFRILHINKISFTTTNKTERQIDYFNPMSRCTRLFTSW